jgi:hypothetical protein
LFTDITPEDSLFGPAFGLPSSSAESHRVSSNSSWTFDGAEPSSLGRYLRNHERHEKIALSTPQVPNKRHSRALGDPAGDVYSPFNTEATLADGSPPNTDFPMHRYLADVQPHEQLALDLEQEDHHQRQTQTKPPDHDEPQSGASSISLSDGPDITDEGEDMMMGIKMPQTEMYAPRDSIPPLVLVTDNLHHHRGKRRRARADSPPRRHKSAKLRKRRSVSSLQGHRDKLAKRC